MDFGAVSLDQGTYGKFANVTDATLWDRLALIAAGTSFPLFTVPLSGTVGAAVKTIADTNNPLGGQIPKGQLWKIFRIRAEYLSQGVKATADIDTLNTFLGEVVVSLLIEGKSIMYQRPLNEILGAPILFHVTPAATFNEFQYSMAGFRGSNELAIPITLAEQTPYQVRIDYPLALGVGNALIGDLIRIDLDGIKWARA